jgi:hypothetical protein
MSRISAVLVVSGLLLLAGCGEEETHSAAAPRPGVTTYAAHGLTVELPAGWRHADASLTPQLVDPREVLAVGTYPLRYRATRCAHLPGSALEDLGSSDAFVTLQERGAGASGLPPRPARFGPELGGASEAAACVPDARFVDHWFEFSDRGRDFHVEVAFGPDASAATRAEAWTILDSLRVDPSARPDWQSSG